MPSIFLTQQSGSGSVSSHTHTDPSPGVSGEPSLESRSQDLIEKSLTVLTHTDSPPAQKYLNTLAAREVRPGQASRTAQGGRGECYVYYVCV